MTGNYLPAPRAWTALSGTLTISKPTLARLETYNSLSHDQSVGSFVGRRNPPTM